MKLRYVFVVLSFVSFIGLVLWGYSMVSDNQGGDGTYVPVIPAPSEPLKTIPEDPGGIEIPHQDSTVFELINRDAHDSQAEESFTIDSNAIPDKVESLFESEESANVLENEKENEKEEQVESAVSSETSLAQEEVAPIIEDTVAEIVPESQVKEAEALEEKQEEVQQVQQTEAVPMPPVKPVPPKPVVVQKKSFEDSVLGSLTGQGKKETQPPLAQQGSGGTHYIQLASVSSEGAARSEWNKMKDKFPSILGDLTPRFIDVDLGDRGIYYRIQAGAMSEAAARKACADLSVAGKSGGCIVVAR